MPRKKHGALPARLADGTVVFDAEGNLHCQADSFPVTVHIPHPNDLGMLRNSLECLVREASKAAQAHGLAGWRKHAEISKKDRSLHNRVRTAKSYRRQHAKVREFLSHAEHVAAKAADTLASLLSLDGVEQWRIDEIERWLADVLMLADQVDMRVLQGVSIPHSEKLFSLHKRYTRWIEKGKAGRPADLGVPVAIVEDQYGFILHHEVMWEGSDVDAAVPLVKGALARHPEMRTCSFDRGFHSPDNQDELGALPVYCALPRKGRLNAQAQQRQGSPQFVAASRKHPRVESAIHSVLQRGLVKVRTGGGKDGFATTVAMGILAGNLNRLGKILLGQTSLDSRKRRR